MKKILSLFSATVLLLIVFSSQDVQARFGGGHSSSSSHSSGGHSYSGSSSSSSWSSHSSSYSSSSSSTGNISLVTFIILIIVVLFIIWIIYKNQPKTMIIRNPNNRFDESQLTIFKQHDANFSRIVFLDFVHLLYVKYYSYYGKKEFSYLTPYLSDSVKKDNMLDLLIGKQVIIIDEIIINSVRLYSMSSTDTEDVIGVEIESNYSIHPAFHTQDTGKQHSRYVRTERWFFQRNKGLLSPAPETMQALSCPACGAAAHFTDAGECDSCRTVIIKGQQQWYVKDRFVLDQTLLNTGDVVSYSEEQGTELPTLNLSITHKYYSNVTT